MYLVYLYLDLIFKKKNNIRDIKAKLFLLVLFK